MYLKCFRIGWLSEMSVIPQFSCEHRTTYIQIDLWMCKKQIAVFGNKSNDWGVRITSADNSHRFHGIYRRAPDDLTEGLCVQKKKMSDILGDKLLLS